MAQKEINKGKYILITGSGAGLGKAFAENSAKLGFDLVLISKFDNELNDVKSEIISKFPKIDIITKVVDLVEDGATAKIIELLNENKVSLFGLINNAGIGYTNHYTLMDENFYKVLLKLNVEIIHQLTYAVLKNKLIPKGGFILNVSSMAALFPLPYKALYAASKAFILQYSQSLYSELKPQGIHVAAVLPGPMPTNKEIAERIKNLGWRKYVANVTEADVMAKKTLDKVFKNKSLIIVTKMDKLNYLISRIVNYKLQTKLINVLSNKPDEELT